MLVLICGSHSWGGERESGFMLIINLHFNYFIDKSEITTCVTVSDLGIQFDQNLCFKSHIITIAIKARCRCAVFLRSFVSRLQP